MSTPTKRQEPVQRKEVPGAPRQVKDSRPKGVDRDDGRPLFDDWAML